MDHLYLSPHFDDAVWSCGGAIAAQSGRGDRVRVLTVCAAEPPPGALSPLAQDLHDRWAAGASPVSIRRAEDRKACAVVGAEPSYLAFLDAIYRVDEGGEPLYSQEREIFGCIHSADMALAEDISAEMGRHLGGNERVYCPIGIGGHVDHQLVRTAAEKLGRKLWFYRDMPYAAQDWETPAWISIPEGEKHLIQVSEEQSEAWRRAAAQYTSQISTFWESPSDMGMALSDYLQEHAGIPVIEAR
jgi:LmbE family N-acetylglucosaminyl deacetylase